MAILARDELGDALHGFEDGVDDPPRRVLVARIGDLRILNLYAPNGGEVGSDKYEYKLVRYRRLRTVLETRCDPASPLALCGAAFRMLVTWGLRDALRLCHPETPGLYTWWD